MNFELVDKNWRGQLQSALQNDGSAMRLICPFVKRDVLQRLLNFANPKKIQIITRFDTCGFYQGVSDLSALRMMLERGASVRGVKNVHAKTYLFGKGTVIVTSANLTAAALDRNAEFGFVSRNSDIWAKCLQYFEEMWSRAGEDLSLQGLERMEATLSAVTKQYGRSQLRRGLPDFGVDLAIPPSDLISEIASEVAMPPQAFVKFWGNGAYAGRLDRSVRIIDEVAHAGSHLVCTYPKRPWQVQNGAMMFMGRLVRDPNDIVVQGRAIAHAHNPNLDVSTPDEVKRREFRSTYKYGIRVEGAAFIDGTLKDGISLNSLMDELGAKSFRKTKERAEAGERRINPRRAYSQQPQVELSEEGFSWLTAKLDAAFLKHGRISQATLNAIESHPLPKSLGL